jgi:nicotinamidase/pyrazinamidase
MKPAVIVVDMVKDTFKDGSRLPIAREGQAIVPNIQKLLKEARARAIPVIFANDDFLKEDFIFKSRFRFHSIRGTEGAEVIDALKPEATDRVLPKRRFSAFFKTDLDRELHSTGVDTIVVAGLTTEFCVLTTVMDGLCHDFSVILLEDCCASHTQERHQACLGLYRESSLYPLLRVMKVSEFLAGC